MGKKELLPGNHKPRIEWPTEAQLCHNLFSLGIELTRSRLIERFEAGEDVTEELIEGFWPSHGQIIHDIVSFVNTLSPKTTPAKTYLNIQTYYLNVLQSLSEIGTTLAKSSWWDRYQAVSDRMGTECIIAIKAAVVVFKYDSDKEGGVILSSLIRLAEVINGGTKCI